MNINRLSVKIDALMYNGTAQNTIYKSNESNLSLKGITTLVQFNQTVNVSIYDSVYNKNYNTTVDQDGNWEVNNIDLSSMSDEVLTIKATVKDVYNNQAITYMQMLKYSKTIVEIDLSSFEDKYSIIIDESNNRANYINAMNIDTFDITGNISNQDDNTLYLGIDDNNEDIQVFVEDISNDEYIKKFYNANKTLDGKLSQLEEGSHNISIYLRNKETNNVIDNINDQVSFIKDTTYPTLSSPLTISNKNSTSDVSTLTFKFSEKMKFESFDTLSTNNYGNITILVETNTTNGQIDNKTLVNIEFDESNYDNYFLNGSNFNNTLVLSLNNSSNKLFFYDKTHYVKITRGVVQDIAQNDYNGTDDLANKSEAFFTFKVLNIDTSKSFLGCTSLELCHIDFI